MTKKELVAKIAKEQNIDPKHLNRMSVADLQKMDLAVADEDGSVLLGGTPDSSPVPTEEPHVPAPSEPAVQSSGSVVVADSGSHERVLIGYHPVTGAEVYE